VVFRLLGEVERHETACVVSSCQCHGYLGMEMGRLREFVYEYEEGRLKRKDAFEGRLEYARMCAERYDFKLSGLIGIYEQEPEGAWEEYQVFRMCRQFETNLRRQDKNYKHGE
jgi:hypothetical protein